MPRFRRQEPSRDRTEEEREAARLEREARRRGDTPRTPAAIRRAESRASEPGPDAAVSDVPDDAYAAEGPAAPPEPPPDLPGTADPAATDGHGAVSLAAHEPVADPAPPVAHAPHVDGSLPPEPPAAPLADAPVSAAPLDLAPAAAEAPEHPLDQLAPPTEAWPAPAPDVVPPAVAGEPPATEVRPAEDVPVAGAGDPVDEGAPTEVWSRDDLAGAGAHRLGDDLAGAGAHRLGDDRAPTEVWSGDEVPGAGPHRLGDDGAPTEVWSGDDVPAAGAHRLDDDDLPPVDAPASSVGQPTEVWAPTGVPHRPDELPPDPDDDPEPLDDLGSPAPVVPPAQARTNRYGDEHERPVPLRRPGARRTLPPTPPAPGGGGRPPRPPRRSGGGGGGEGGDEGGRRRRLRPALLLALLAILLLLGIAAFVAASVYQPFGTENAGRVRVAVPENATAAEISDLLEREGVISSAFFFDLRARLDGGREGFRAGTYTLRRDMPYDEAIEALTVGPPPARVINVTVPEGRSRRETAPLVEQAGLRGNYLRASRRPTQGFSLRRYGAPSGNGLEGFLFPATYELRPRASARTLVARQLDAFEENFAEVDLRRARARNLSRYDVLIIASMIEREATLARERRLMSAVIHNRLRQGIPLGIDATTRYETNNWTRPIRQSELEADTPYNTRLNTGLPPGPIGNPGLASMRAAANPADSDVLYYVARICGEGAHEFSASDAEFQRDVARYNAERERRGGRAPTNC